MKKVWTKKMHFAFNELKKKDILFEKIIEMYGLPKDRSIPNNFASLARIIIGQQISVAAATTISGRITASFGTKVSTGSDLNLVFPSADVLADADLNDVGLTERRKVTIQTFARSVLDGSIDFETPKDLQDIERSWCALPGIGPWTAQVAAMRVLGHNDAMPASDLGILRSVNNIAEQDLSSEALQKQSKVWAPFRSWAAQHLWQAPKSIGIPDEQPSFMPRSVDAHWEPHPGEH